MDIGFVGLGAMGRGMALCLKNAGHELIVWNRTAAKTRALADAGARVATSPAEAARAGRVITKLADDAAVESSVLGDDGILSGLPARGLHIGCSTISADLSGRLTRAHHERGSRFVSAPVFGRPDAAAAAKLFVVAAGEAGALEAARPVFDVIGQRTFIVGAEPRQAALVKLAGNFLITCVIEGLAEAMTLVAKEGVSQKAFIDLLTSTLFAAPVYQTYGRILIEERFKPAGFALPLGLKDNRLLLQAAEHAAVPLPFASVVRDHMIAAMARGFADEDWSAIARIVAEEAGLEGHARTHVLS
jgi:3-hydroxyisobutyrate dehydrogenase-like beta-hydroxyacid dehydrogenase